MKTWLQFSSNILTNKCESLVVVAHWLLLEFHYFCVHPYWPKAGQYGSFPCVSGARLCPQSPIFGACSLDYSSWCGRASLHWCQSCQLSVKEQTGHGSCGEETLLRSPAHQLVLRWFIKVSSLVSMRRCPLCPLSAICDSLYSSKPHSFNESLKAVAPSVPLTGCPGFVLDWCTQNDFYSQNAQLVR